MAQIEKTVFISYRRSDVYTALAVYQDLKNHGYDVFFDYRSISSGDFEQIITSNIKARAHFLLILTPTALDRINEPGDWLKREIETAIDEKRNIVPLFFRGFRFGVSSKSGMSRLLRLEKPEVLTGKLKDLSRYNGLNVHEDYFDEAMHRLRSEYLNKPLDTVLHPVSNTVQRIVKEEQIAADKALEKIENVQELVKIAEEKPAREREAPQPVVSQVAAGDAGKRPRAAPQKPSAEKTPSLLPDWKSLASRFNLRVLLGIGALLVVVSLAVAAFPALRDLFARGVGSTKIGKDDATLVYVPAGEFMMGSESYDNEKPIHTISLDAFWIDKTEVTNAMYAKCVDADVCEEPTNKISSTHSSYYGNAEFDNYPVIYVDWNGAKTYCEWAGRRLPTEAEWEKAARGENANVYPWGNDPPNNNLLNYNGAVGDTTEVGSYLDSASVYGALDMAGNVWEWVNDWHSETYYSSSPSSNPEGPSSGQYRVLRGGAWGGSGDGVRSANRVGSDPTYTNLNIGFRCAVSANRQADVTPLAQASTNIPSTIQTSQPTITDTPSPTETSIPATPTLGIGSTMTGQDGMTLLYVPAGEFTMGSNEGQPEEQPAHKVNLDAFWIDKTEVTNKMYSLCVTAGICQAPANKSSIEYSSYYGDSQFDNYPVIYVDWNGAKTYCEWADRQMPTEAQWEKAARGTDGRTYPWGNDSRYHNILNYNIPAGWIDEVDLYPDRASPYGALDMADNVWEWVADWFDANYYKNSPSSNPSGPSSGNYRIVRGGWLTYYGYSVRSPFRNRNNPDISNGIIGFRCVMSATP